MKRYYNLRGISAKLIILQEVGTDWQVTLPASSLPFYRPYIIPDFNEEACYDC